MPVFVPLTTSGKESAPFWRNARLFGLGAKRETSSWRDWGVAVLAAHAWPNAVACPQNAASGGKRCPGRLSGNECGGESADPASVRIFRGRPSGRTVQRLRTPDEKEHQRRQFERPGQARRQRL